MKTQFSKLKKQAQRGFTLVEIAIVLVIIGLLIGGILRGQELITSARVRNIIDQKSSVQAAYYGFIDRYRAQPGDLTTNQALQVNSSTAEANTPGNGVVEWNDSIAYFNNLSQSGFLACDPCMKKRVYTDYSTIGYNADNSPVNTFGSAIWVAQYPGSTTGHLYLDKGAGPTRMLLSTGGGVASDVQAELDRKLDDGNPETGSFRYTSWAWGQTLGEGAVSAACVVAAAGSGTTATPARWKVDTPTDCSGVNLL